MTLRFDPTRTDFEPYGLTFTQWQAAPMDRPDRHNEIEINLLLTAPLNYQIGGRRVSIQPQTLTVFWAALPHQIVPPIFDDTYYVATIPLSKFLRFGLPEEMVQSILHGNVLSADIDSIVSIAQQRFDTWIEDLESGNSSRLNAATLELQSMLLRMWSVIKSTLATTNPAPLQGLQPTELSAVERIAAYIALHHTEELTVDIISSQVGLASGYAMTLFRKVFGQTMMENLLDHRLAHAQRLLISSDSQILTIAFESGFGSLSRFNTAFKQHCSCSPSQYRKLHRDQLA